MANGGMSPAPSLSLSSSAQPPPSSLSPGSVGCSTSLPNSISTSTSTSFPTSWLRPLPDDALLPITECRQMAATARSHRQGDVLALPCPSLLLHVPRVRPGSPMLHRYHRPHHRQPHRHQCPETTSGHLNSASGLA